jgi:hypothetical protein
MVHFGVLRSIAWPRIDQCHHRTVDEVESKGSELRREEKSAVSALRAQPGMNLQRFAAAATAISEEYASILHDSPLREIRGRGCRFSDIFQFSCWG